MGQIFLLDEAHNFPDPRKYYTSADHPFCLGGDLHPNRVLQAYRLGIFPWFIKGEEIAWWCPDPRFVLFPKAFRIHPSMRNFLKKTNFVVTENQAFSLVIKHCRYATRQDQPGESWITDEMEESYMHLYQIGVAKSWEVWEKDELVGGLYGIELGQVFCGESMFALRSNASKLALYHVVNNGRFSLIDCQVYSTHLASLGAEFIAKEQFLSALPPAPASPFERAI